MSFDDDQYDPEKVLLAPIRRKKMPPPPPAPPPMRGAGNWRWEKRYFINPESEKKMDFGDEQYDPTDVVQGNPAIHAGPTPPLFDLGDRVMLNVGGPAMSVNGIFGEGDETEIVCVWFDGGNLQQGKFAPQTLVKLPNLT